MTDSFGGCYFPALVQREGYRITVYRRKGKTEKTGQVGFTRERPEMPSQRASGHLSKSQSMKHDSKQVIKLISEIKEFNIKAKDVACS